jgi:hypothetical protein
MVVRLTAKLAEVVNGVDLSRYREGDVIELPARDAAMLLAERWAELVGDTGASNDPPAWRPDARAIAADRNRTRDRK